MSETPMVIWNVKKLANQFGLSQHRVNKILKSIGAKKWTCGSGPNGTKYYWDSED